MKKLSTIVILGILLPAAIARAGDLRVSESLIDYGTVKEGPPVIKKIVLTNGGSRPLAIANAAAS